MNAVWRRVASSSAPADPALPPIQCLQEAPYLTYRTVFDLDQRPCRLPVLGGGATSVELSQAFRRLGSEVTVLERRDRLIPIADPEASALVAEHFRDEGIGLVVGAEVQQVQRGPGKVGLEDIGVRLGRRGIEVDARLRTSVRLVPRARRNDAAGCPHAGSCRIR